uniref:Putative transmembrane protein n=1 Tax=Toxoplasma gondii COUG TaxID=1074873 RepID=A0A2G8XN43_TOXGO|nr:putative transmembrane protein [Toxoplasma gondii COUG]
MERCKPKGGYENPAIGLWAVGCTMQLVSALLLLMLASALKEVKDLAGNPAKPEVRLLEVSAFVGLGVSQVVVSLLVAAVVLLGYFVSDWFLVLSAFVGFLVEVVALACSVICGIILTGVATKQAEAIDYVRTAGAAAPVPVPVLDYSAEFGATYQGMIVAFGVLSVASLVPLARAQAMAPNTRAMEAMVFVFCITLCLVVAAVFLLQSEALASDRALGILWVAAAVVALAFVSLQKAFLPRIMSIVLAVVFVLIAIYAVVSTFVCANEFLKQKKLYATASRVLQSQMAAWIQSLSDDDYGTLLRGYRTSDGVYFLIAASISGAVFIFVVAGALAAFRSVCGPSRAEKLMSRESAEEAIEAREAHVREEQVQDP